MTQYQDDDDDVSHELSGQSLNKAEFEDGRSQTLKITAVAKKVFEAKNGRPADVRRVLTFENGKTLPLNTTNLALMAKWYGKKPSAWVGKRVTAYRDDNVMFAGQLTGGWRLRKPSKHDALPVADPPTVEDVPF